MLLARALVYMGYRRQTVAAVNGVRWARLYTVVTFLVGVIWGLLPVLFLDVEQPEVFIGISIMIVGLSAGSIALYAPWPSALIEFITPAMLMLSFSIMVLGESFIVIGATVFAAYLIYIWLSLVSYGRVRHAVLMQFRNEELVASPGAGKEPAEAANRAKSQLLAAISHDLRQPLQSIRLYTDLLEQRTSRTGGQ